MTSASSAEAMSRSLLRVGRYGDAEEKLLQALVSEPDNPMLHFLLSFARCQADDLPGARRAAEQAISLDPDYSDGHAMLGYALTRSKKYGPAIAALDDAIRCNPTNDFAHARLAVALALKAGRRLESRWQKARAKARLHLSQAVVSAETAIELAPHEPDHFVALSYAQLQNKQQEAAKQAASEALRLDPNSSAAHLAVAQVRQAEGDIRGASDAYVGAGRADPNVGGLALRGLRSLSTAAGPVSIGALGIWGIIRLIRLVVEATSYGAWAAGGVIAAILLVVTGAVVFEDRKDKRETRRQMVSEATSVLQADKEMRQELRRYRRTNGL